MKDLSDCRILIVDDIKSNLDVLVGALGDDYELSVAFDGKRALELIRKDPPDLVLLDVMMPKLDGYEVCRLLREDPETRELPVMFLTALDEVENKTKGFEVGGSDYVTKPFEILEVRARVRSLLKAKAYADAQREAIQAELRVAREIQMGQVRLDTGTLGDRVDVAAVLEPAKQVGGDLYQVFPLDERRLCIAVGDVSDKGIPAAMFVAVTTTLLRTLANVDTEPERILSRLNEELAAENPACMFVTLFLGILDVQTAVLSCASGGHCAPVILVPGEAPRFAYESLGTAVGLAKGVPFHCADIRLHPGERFVLYTDGITEALDASGALLGEEGLLKGLAEATSATAGDVVDAVLSTVREFAGDAPQSDDLAVVVLGMEAAGAVEDDVLELSLTAAREEVGRAVDELRSRCESRGVPAEATHDLCLAADELLANSVIHGHGESGAPEIVFEAHFEPREVRLVVRDTAAAFDPLTKEAPDLGVDPDDRQIGGLGIHLVRSLMDDLSYERADGENRTTVVKRL